MSRVFVVFSLAFGSLLRVNAQTNSPTPSATPILNANGTEAEANRVIVTGSHIPTAEEVGPNPVQEITQEQIQNSGERTAAELIRQLPQSGHAGVPTANNGFGDQGPAGTASIALRGFDASSTLVLIDGRRVAPYPLGAPPTFAASFVDLNSIPKAALDSVEVLPDSASAIYGADAVAGVVNIKFRHDYKGAEVSTSYGNTLDKDSGEETASLIFGVGDNRTNLTGTVNYYHRNGLFDRDRGFSQKAPFPALSFSASPFNLQLYRDAVLAAGVPPDQLPPGPVFGGHAPFFTNGLAPATDYVYTPRANAVRYNPNLDAQAIPDTEQYGGYLSATRKLFGDQLQLYSDVSYQKVDTFYVLSPTATNFFETPGSTTLAIPPHAPGPVIAGPSYEETGVPFGAYNPFNPFQQIISGTSRARLVELGDRTSDTVTEAVLATLGVKGDKLFDGNWGYDSGLRFSQVQGTNTLGGGGVSASRFNRILNAADPIYDPSSPQYIGTTIPYNPFGDYRRPIASNQIPAEFASVTVKEVDTSDLETADLNLYTTSLFELPAGGVGFAFGGQFRNETLELRPDPLQLGGDILGQTPGEIITASREAFAIYAEATVPIVSSLHPLPGIRSLEFTGAARFEDFLNNNTNVLVPKVGMRWQPFDESLTIRATWGEGFHQPSLLELFANPQSGIDSDFIDPLTHQPVPELPFIIRGNPNLQPEDSRAFSAGFVYTPRFDKNLTLSVTLYDIESTGRAFIPDLQGVINRSVTGQLLPLEKVIRDASGNIIAIEEAFQNAGSRKARGADFGISYQLETQFGTFTSLTRATFLDSLQFAETANEPEVELVRGGFFHANTAALQWRGDSSLDWNWRGFSLGVTAFYFDGFHEYLFSPEGRETVPHWVSQTWLFDVRASYAFHAAKTSAVPSTSKDDKQALAAESQTTTAALPRWQRWLDGTTISIGCNNVFGQDPPQAFTGLNYPGNIYDPTGRFVYIRLTKDFF